MMQTEDDPFLPFGDGSFSGTKLLNFQGVFLSLMGFFWKKFLTQKLPILMAFENTRGVFLRRFIEMTTLPNGSLKKRIEMLITRNCKQYLR